MVGVKSRHLSAAGRDTLIREHRSAVSQRPAVPSVQVSLSLLGGFGLSVSDEPVPVPYCTQRLVAFLALRDGAFTRAEVAGTLWSDASEAQSSASLRTALWRLGEHRANVVQTMGRTHLCLASHIAVDYRQAMTDARAMLEEDALIDRTTLLLRELLPGWDEDWVHMERERFRQLRLHALDAFCRRLVEAGRFAEATQVAMTVVTQEPLRDTVHEILISAHLAQGNHAEALRHYELYARRMRETLNLSPSPRVARLLSAAAIR